MFMGGAKKLILGGARSTAENAVGSHQFMKSLAGVAQVMNLMINYV